MDYSATFPNAYRPESQKREMNNYATDKSKGLFY